MTPENWRELRRLLAYLAVMVPLTVALLWFSWDLTMYMLKTPACARQGTCLTDR